MIYPLSRSRPAAPGSPALHLGGRLRCWFFERLFSRLTIGARVAAIALTLAVPLNLVIAAVIWHLSQAANEAQRTSLLYTAHSVAGAVDAKLGEYMDFAQALARSPALLEDNLGAFESEARRAFASMPDAHIMLANAEGQQLINTAQGPGERLPFRDPIGLAAQRRTFETRSPLTADVRVGAVARDWIVNIDVPIFRDGQPFRALAVAVSAKSFFGLLNAQRMPKHWLACLTDRRGHFVARVPGHEQNVGQLAAEGFRKVQGRDGIFEFLSVEGEPIITAVAHSAVSGWPVAIAIKKADMQAATWKAINWAFFLGGGFSLFSWLLTGAIARSITRPISELRQKSSGLLAEPAPATPPLGPPEVRDLWRALKQSAADRYHSDQKLRLALTAAELGTWRMETRTREIQWDERSKALFGLPPDARVSYKNWANAILPEDKVSAEADVARALDPDEPHDEMACEFRVRHPDGTVRWLSSIGRAFFEPDPQSRSGRRAVFISGAMRDVTAVHMASATLGASEERFRGVFENAATGIAILDLDGRFQSCNPAFSAVLGYSEEELRQFSFSELVHPEDRDANASQARRLLSQQIPFFEIVMRYLRKDGKPSWAQKYVSLLRDGTGKPTHILALVTDITERKRQEDQIRLLMREVNHRSKNMLALVQAIARQTLAANPQDFLDRFGKRVEALAASQDLLVKNAWKGVDLNDLVRSQLAPFEDLVGTRVELRGPPLFVSASAAQPIGMALHELATNAGKYGALSDGDGRVEISWRVERDGSGEETFVMGWLEHPTHAISTPAKPGFGSSVIGGMAEMSLGAKVELNFPPTGLTWQLRALSGEILDGGLRLVRKSESARPATAAHASLRPRILVVEDEALVATEIAHVLTRAGFEILGPARSTGVALDLLKCFGCDAAVLDINLGRETSEAVAAELTVRRIPFVTLSGYSREEHHSAFAGAPALAKPIRPELLIAQLRKYIEQNDAGSKGQAGSPPPESESTFDAWP